MIMTPDFQRPVPGNRSIKPSFRRKPESRTLCSRLALFREDFLDSGFRRNDGCTGCAWIALVRRDCPAIP